MGPSLRREGTRGLAGASARGRGSQMSPGTPGVDLDLRKRGRGDSPCGGRDTGRAGKQGLATGTQEGTFTGANTSQRPSRVNRTLTSLLLILPQTFANCLWRQGRQRLGGSSWAQNSSKQQVPTPSTCIPWLSWPACPNSYTSPTKLRPQDGPGIAARRAGVGAPSGGALSVGEKESAGGSTFCPSLPPLPLPLSPSFLPQPSAAARCSVSLRLSGQGGWW